MPIVRRQRNEPKTPAGALRTFVKPSRNDDNCCCNEISGSDGINLAWYYRLSVHGLELSERIIWIGEILGARFLED